MSDIARLRWDGSRAGVERLCRWANDRDEAADEPFVMYEFAGADDVQSASVATDDGDYADLRPWDWLVQTETGFRVEHTDGFSTQDDPDPLSASPTGLCGSPVKCRYCPSTFLCYTKALDEKQLIATRQTSTAARRFT